MGEQNLLFVYGSLRRAAATPMQTWLARHSRWLGSASVRGRLYRVASYPGLIRIGRQRVQGDLYRLRGARPWRRLDAYEGIGPTMPRPCEYRRLRLPVRDDHGRQRSAWVYLYNWPLRRRPPIRSGDYLGG